MKSPDKKIDLDQAIQSLKSAECDPRELEAASERVWTRLHVADTAVGTIHTCEDVRALVPMFRAGALPRPRYLLVQDHLQECVHCRHYAESGTIAVEKQWQTAMPILRSWQPSRFALAAATVVITVSAVFAYVLLTAVPAGARGRVETAQGALFLINSQGERPVFPGAELNEGESLRTASGAHAFVRLRDGSLVEVNERAQFSVSAWRKDTTVHLDRGRIIVQAAHRTSGHLYVATPDSKVAVTGTVFSVNSGTIGSRVAVVEGEVHVVHDGIEAVLHSDDTLNTTPGMETVPVQDEIAWSEKLTEHLKLLAEFSKIERKLASMPGPAPRYESKLMQFAPADTVIYAAIPNIGETFRQVDQAVEQQLQQSPELSRWWTQREAGYTGPTPKEIAAKVVGLSQYLGNEVVLFATQDTVGKRGSPVLIAPITQAGLREYVEGQIAEISNPGEHAPRVFSPGELAAATGNGRDAMLILVRPDYLVAACDIATLQAMNAQLNAGPSAFGETGFGQRLRQAYSGGISVIFAADVQRIHEGSPGNVHANAALERSGFADLRYVVFQQQQAGAQSSGSLSLEFNGSRKGIASWLGAPGPMGSLQFVSPDAALVASVVSKTPAEMFDDILSMQTAASPAAQQHFQEFQSKLNFDLRADLAATMGTDATLALDGPVLPIPSWKLIAEVYDPARLQSTIQKIVEESNREAGARGKEPNQVTQEEVNGQIFYMIHGPEGSSVNYTFSGGYLIVAPSRALLTAAIDTSKSGLSLARSSSFRTLVAAGDHVDFSAFLYQNLGPVLGPLAQQVNSEQMKALQQLAADAHPTLVAAYGEPNSIQVVTNSRFFGLDFSTLAMAGLMEHKKPGTSPVSVP